MLHRQRNRFILENTFLSDQCSHFGAEAQHFGDHSCLHHQGIMGWVEEHWCANSETSATLGTVDFHTQCVHS